MMSFLSGILTCVSCNPTLQNAVFDDRFLGRLLILAAPLPLVAGGIALVVYAIGKQTQLNGSDRSAAVRTLAAVMTIGVGLGGFVDGIVLHQVLQWHEMFSNTQPPHTLLDKSVNMFWDGLFHAATWLVTFGGLVWLWRLFVRGHAFKANGLLAGGLTMGWAMFNLIEGTLNHYLFNVHNVREITANPDAFNHAFTVFSILLLAAGWWITARAMRNAQQTAPTQPSL